LVTQPGLPSPAWATTGRRSTTNTSRSIDRIGRKGRGRESKT
jgi:hypothetical protein